MKKIIFIFFAITTIACNNSQEVNSENPTIFNVSKEYLGEKIYDSTLQVSFSPPVKWLPNNSIKNLIKEKIAQDNVDEFNDINLLYLLSDDSTNNTLSIWDISKVSINKLDSLKGIYRAQAIETSRTEEAISGFYYNGFYVVQYIIQQTESVNLKLIFYRNSMPLIQADYFIKNEFYKNSMKSLESSVGSFTFGTNY